MKQRAAAVFRKLVFLAIVAVAPFLYTADEPEQSDSTDLQDPIEEQEPENEDNVKNSEVEENESPLIFIPSENISEDFAVPYPVDI